MPRTRTLLLAASLLPGLAVAAVAEDPDALFLQARSLPKERREEARALCRKALEGSPDYHDIRIHLARLYAWDGRYEEARREIRTVLAKVPKNAEARTVAIDLEVWSDHPHDALRLCEEAMALDPGNAEWGYRKARVLRSLGDLPGAYAAVQAALALNPNHDAARRLRDDLKELQVRSKVTLDVGYETYSTSLDPWKTLAASVGHRFDLGTGILRVTRANHFSEWGTQVEADAYPRLRDGTYAYLNVGTSSDSIFPKSSYAAELYQSLPRGFEASLGFRHLGFDPAVTIYTGTLSLYHGNALYTLRLNHTPSDLGASNSGSLLARFYGADADDYLTASVGMGVSPDQPIWSPYIALLHSRKASLGFQKRGWRVWVFSAGATYERQEFLPDEYRTHLTYQAGVEYRF